MTDTPENEPGPESEPDREEDFDVERSPTGGLPWSIIIIAVVIFAVLYWAFRSWRSQHVSYTGDAAEQLTGVLTILGL